MAISLAAALAAPGCGGGQSAGPGGATARGQDTSAADDLDVPAEGEPDEAAGEGDETGGADAPAEDAPAVTFRLVNAAKEDLVFSLDKGWQPVIFAFSGKPPKAKPILMFPKFCTASCEAAAAERCPYCPEPERVKDIKAAEKREVLAPGKSLDVPWDARVHVYDKSKGERDGRSVKCECFRTEPVAPETYTVRACGFRITKSADAASKYQCVEGKMTFPADGPQVVELRFAEQ